MDRPTIEAAIRAAQSVTSRGPLRKVPNGFKNIPSSDYDAAEFDVPTLGRTESWTLCTAPMVSSSFQLLDATVNAKLKAGTRYAVALLQARPAKDGKGPAPSEDYLRRYQQVAWSAFGVAWVLAAGEDQLKFLADPAPKPPAPDDFASIAAKIKERLDGLHIAPRPTKSREGEKLIYPAIDAALKEFGFAAATTRNYEGFWRRPEADGLWTRGSGSPGSFALEVKLDEDSTNPLCQAVEPLGVADAMVYVRLAKDGPKNRVSPLAEQAKQMLQGAAPVRYLSVRTE